MHSDDIEEVSEALQRVNILDLGFNILLSPEKVKAEPDQRQTSNYVLKISFNGRHNFLVSDFAEKQL